MLLSSESKDKLINQASLQPLALDFLLKEYDVLNNYYSQSNERLQGRFNLYLTILSATIGGITWIIQNSSTDRTWFLLVGGLLLFLSSIGVFFEHSIVLLYADLERYALAISDIRKFIVKRIPEVAPALYEHPFKGHFAQKRTIFQWFLPQGVFQSFISTANSICFASITVIIAISFPVSISIAKIIIASISVFLITSVTQSIWSTMQRRRALTRLQRKMDSLITHLDASAK